MKTKETWMWRDAKLWQFWLPQSGLAGGLVWGLILTILFLLFGGDAHAQFAYECYRPDGSSFISDDKCAAGLQWRRIQTDPYYNVPVTRVYERQVQGGTVVTRQLSAPPTVVQAPASQAQPAPVQQGYSNEELSRELNERYKQYGGYRPGHTFYKSKSGKSYGWYK